MKIPMIFFLLLPLSLLSQVKENFENSSLQVWLQSNYLRWDTSSFQSINGKYSLHHIFDNPDADYDQISLNHKPLLLDSATATWQFKIKHGYNPSSNNNWGVFLVSDKNALYMYPGSNINGYVIGVNYSGYDDLIKLWKVSSGDIYTVINTNFNWEGNFGTDRAVEFEITRNESGNWIIKSDSSAGFNNPFILGTGQDSELNYSEFFGIYYKYSASQDQKLWFDDLLIDGYFYDDSISFLYYEPKPYDVLITEIMADPEPSVLLPEAEYLELYNKSDNVIKLSGWKITIGNLTVNLPSSTIKSNEYIIITNSANNFILKNYGNILYVNGFPGLNNSGQTVTLRDSKNSIIHSVSYSSKWFDTEYKAEGGWSLEIIDVKNPCGKKENWAESTDYKGGTPGQVNSVSDSKSDNAAPLVKRAAVISDSIIQIYFNESLDSLSLINPGNYFVDHNTGTPTAIFPVFPDFSSVKLVFNNPFENNFFYTITIKNKITDCVGNALENNSTAKFAMPEEADSFDLVINEILFNPYENGEDFVEIYNRSKKTIDIRYFNLAACESFSNEVNSCYPIIKEHFLLFPAEYVLLTTDINNIQQQYINTNTDYFIEMENMPPSPNNKGIVIITDNQLNILDEFHYSEEMHFKLLNSCEGVSLERINSEWPTNNPNNWHSASEDFSFATPGYKNSQYCDFESGQNQIIIEPEVFSPDNDGYNDFVNILYSFGNPGFIANITIFDSKGRAAKYLVKNTLLGIEGGFTWDGINEDNRRADMGIYLIYTEIFDLSGKIYKFKNTCVLALKTN